MEVTRGRRCQRGTERSAGSPLPRARSDRGCVGGRRRGGVASAVAGPPRGLERVKLQMRTARGSSGRCASQCSRTLAAVGVREGGAGCHLYSAHGVPRGGWRHQLWWYSALSAPIVQGGQPQAPSIRPSNRCTVGVAQLVSQRSALRMRSSAATMPVPSAQRAPQSGVRLCPCEDAERWCAEGRG